MMLSCVVLFGALFVLEVLFWLTPFKHVMDKLSLKGTSFYVFPIHYWVRILVTVVVLINLHLAMPAAFGGGYGGWASSFTVGLVLCAISLAVFRIPPLRALEVVRSASSVRYWTHSAYILIYPSLVEEMLFRWLLVGMLQPTYGWWVLVLAPTVNLIWHLPVWMHSWRANETIPWKQVFTVVIQAWVFGLTLTGTYVATQNLIGVILAHFFGDWVNATMQYAAAQSRQGSSHEGIAF